MRRDTKLEIQNLTTMKLRLRNMFAFDLLTCLEEIHEGLLLCKLKSWKIETGLRIIHVACTHVC